MGLVWNRQNEVTIAAHNCRGHCGLVSFSRERAEKKTFIPLIKPPLRKAHNTLKHNCILSGRGWVERTGRQGRGRRKGADGCTPVLYFE